jgi:hypothetical protein
MDDQLFQAVNRIAPRHHGCVPSYGYVTSGTKVAAATTVIMTCSPRAPSYASRPQIVELSSCPSSGRVPCMSRRSCRSELGICRGLLVDQANRAMQMAPATRQ